ncbi:oligosaccharide flippase family protein [bacterium]|nr:oligosaccharide flippase family protein [bacterium]
MKRLTRHTAVYGIGHILSRFIGFLLLPIHTNYLKPDVYGLASLLFSSLAILNVLFTYGMDVAFLRYFILADSREEKRRIFGTCFWMILTSSLFLSGILFAFPALFSEWIFRSSAYRSLIRISAGILAADALSLLPFLILRAEEKSGQFVFQKALNILANMVSNIILVAWLGKGLEGVFISNLIASCLTLCTLAPVVMRWLRLVFNFRILDSILHFGLPYIPSGLAVIIMDQIGRFFLDRIRGQAATGIFSANYKIGMFMAILVAAFRFAWHPFFLSASRQDDAPRLFARVFTYFLCLTFFFFLAVSLFVKEIIGFRIAGFRLFGEGYGMGAGIVPVILLSYIAYGAYLNFMVGIHLKKKTAVLPWITWIGAGTAILANRLLIPTWGISGAAWATFLAYFIMAASLYRVGRRLYPVPYEWGRVLKIAGIASLLAALGASAPAGARVWVRGLLMLGFFPLLHLAGFLKADEKSRLKRLWMRRICRQG